MICGSRPQVRPLLQMKLVRVSVFFFSVTSHLPSEVYHMILSVLYYPIGDVWVLQVNSLAEGENFEGLNDLKLLRRRNLPADPFYVESESLIHLGPWKKLLLVDV